MQFLTIITIIAGFYLLSSPAKQSSNRPRLNTRLQEDEEFQKRSKELKEWNKIEDV
jgi:hypothetical protein